MGLQRNDFVTRLHASMEDRSFVKLTLGHAAEPGSPLRKLMFRPVEIRGERLCAIVSRFTNQDQTANKSFAEALELIEAKLGTEFLSGHLFTETEEIQLQLGQGDRKSRLRVLQAKHAPAVLGHDRTKSRWVEPKSDYLAALGVTDSSGKIRMGDKFRQIERFVDLLASAFRESDLGGVTKRSFTLCDMGSGKGYLTFAAYDYLQRHAKVPAIVTGVEARPELVHLCNRVAKQCGFEHLSFLRSTIEEFPLPALDLLVALHACDTATDDALAAGICANASVILVAPCCQKELRSQVDRAGADSPLRDVLRHGIFAERHAEIATDALRSLLMERAGYRVRVCEFVAPEHTAKNIMLIATRRTEKPGASVEADLDRRISELKSFYGIQHHRLQQLLMEGRQLGRAPQTADPVP